MASSTTHPYVRNNFKGTVELQKEREERIIEVQRTKPLLTDNELDLLMLKRKELGLGLN